MTTIPAIIISIGVVGPPLMLVKEKRGTQLDLKEETKRLIEQEGIYHLTDKEGAERIMKSGYLAPSIGRMNNHYSKSRNSEDYADYVYMFAGKPNLVRLAGNLLHRFGEKSDGTFYAIKHTPDKFEMENYTERLSDGAITYEGKLDIKNSNPQIVRMKLEKGRLIEIPLDEYVKTESFPKRLIKKAAAITLSLASGLTEFVLSPKSTLKMKRLKAERKLTNKLLEQYNLEKEKQSLDFDKDGQSYSLVQGNDRIIDGRLLSEFELMSENAQEGIKIYMDSRDLSTFSEDELKEFFTQNIDFKSELNQYIGRPQRKEKQVTQDIDAEFEEHFRKKQEAKKKTDPLYEKLQYERLQSERSKKQHRLFRKIYEKTSAKHRRQAQEYLSRLKSKEKTQAREVNEKGRDYE